MIGQGTTQSAAQDDKQEDPKFELSGLDTFLKNKDGMLIQYFNITFEEFERVYNALNSRKKLDSSDLFAIRTATVVAKVRSLSANLEVELNVVPNADDEIEIPIALDDLIFPRPDKRLIRREGKFYVRFKGKAGEESTVKLQAVQKMKIRRGRKELKLDLPSAAFTTVQIHEIEPDMNFSADQEAISKSITPFFASGSSYEFSGLKESTVVSWSKTEKKALGMLGTISQGANISAIIEQNRIRYEASLSIRSKDSISGLRIGLPQATSETSIDPASGMILRRDVEEDAWKIYQIDFGRQGTSFDDVRFQWTVPRSKDNMNLVGFEVFGFQFLGGQLVVRGGENVSFVLANRFNLDNQNRIVPNQHHTYDVTSPIFSASVFTIVDSPEVVKRADLNLKLDSQISTFEMELPNDLNPENPAAVTIQLNGWQLSPGQENLVVDKLTQKVEVSPVFFLSENQSRKISFVQDSRRFGEREFVFPQLNNLNPGRFRMLISCSPDVTAKLERNSNPGLEISSQFESEVISTGKNLTVNVQAPSFPKIKLRLDPVIPFVKGERLLQVTESKGRFYLDSSCTISSSRVFDSLVILSAGNVDTLSLDGKRVEQAGLVPGKPFLLELDESRKEVKIETRLKLGEWDESKPVQHSLSRFLLPVVGDGSNSNQEVLEVQGRNFSAINMESELSVLTSSGISVVPDDKWVQSGSSSNGQTSLYTGTESTTLELTKNVLSDEEVHVKQAWIHTSLNEDYRQDRVVLRFVPKRSIVQWRVPEGTRLVACRLNGKPVSAMQIQGEGLVVTEFEELFDEHLIEFDLRFFHAASDNQLFVRLPKTNRVLWCQKFYWSLNLPDSRYVLNYSNGLSSSYVLSWTGFFLRPSPNLSVRQLERWIGAAIQSELGGQGNDYLFTTFGIVDDRSVFIISKRNLVLIFGLVFISLGCAFVSLSFMRNAIFLVAIAAGVLILGIWYPIWFIQLLQIEVFVGFLFCVGFVLTRLTSWIRPANAETRIETNVPSLVLAAPDSGIEQSAETRAIAAESKGGE